MITAQNMTSNQTQQIIDPSKQDCSIQFLQQLVEASPEERDLLMGRVNVLKTFLQKINDLINQDTVSDLDTFRNGLTTYPHIHDLLKNPDNLYQIILGVENIALVYQTNDENISNQHVHYNIWKLKLYQETLFFLKNKLQLNNHYLKASIYLHYLLIENTLNLAEHCSLFQNFESCDAELIECEYLYTIRRNFLTQVLEIYQDIEPFLLMTFNHDNDLAKKPISNIENLDQNNLQLTLLPFCWTFIQAKIKAHHNLSLLAIHYKDKALLSAHKNALVVTTQLAFDKYNIIAPYIKMSKNDFFKEVLKYGPHIQKIENSCSMEETNLEKCIKEMYLLSGETMPSLCEAVTCNEILKSIEKIPSLSLKNRAKCFKHDLSILHSVMSLNNVDTNTRLATITLARAWTQWLKSNLESVQVPYLELTIELLYNFSIQLTSPLTHLSNERLENITQSLHNFRQSIKSIDDITHDINQIKDVHSTSTPTKNTHAHTKNRKKKNTARTQRRALPKTQPENTSKNTPEDFESSLENLTQSFENTHIHSEAPRKRFFKPKRNAPSHIVKILQRPKVLQDISNTTTQTQTSTISQPAFHSIKPNTHLIDSLIANPRKIFKIIRNATHSQSFWSNRMQKAILASAPHISTLPFNQLLYHFSELFLKGNACLHLKVCFSLGLIPHVILAPNPDNLMKQSLAFSYIQTALSQLDYYPIQIVVDQNRTYLFALFLLPILEELRTLDYANEELRYSLFSIENTIANVLKTFFSQYKGNFPLNERKNLYYQFFALLKDFLWPDFISYRANLLNCTYCNQQYCYPPNAFYHPLETSSVTEQPSNESDLPYENHPLTFIYPTASLAPKSFIQEEELIGSPQKPKRRMTI